MIRTHLRKAVTHVVVVFKKRMKKQQSSSTQLSKRASVTKQEAAALDQTKVTNMAATHPHLLAPTVQSQRHEVRDSHMSRSSIRHA